MTYPIYTYGSGYIEWYALSSIAALTSSALFAATLKVMALLAAFTVFIGLLSPKSPITQGGHIKIGIGFISILLVSMLIFGPKINVAVIDSVSPLAIPNGGVVNNVPIGVGLPISLASQVANGLVNGVETAFSSPAVGGPGSSTDFTSAGMGVAISMPLQSYSDSITDPTLQSNFNYYFENCIDPAIANGTISPTEIADAGLANPINNVSNAPTTFQAQSLWSLFQSISNQIPGPGGLTTNFINPTTGSNSTVSCQNDYTNVYDEASSYGQTFFQQESESLGYTSYSAVSSLLSNINQNVLNVGNDGMQEQMQAFAVNLTNSAIPQIAAASGITSTQAAYSTGLAEAGWGASIAPMLLTAQQFMPGMLSLLFVVITIASPFLLMFLMFPWGGRYLQVYMTLLLWMVLWLPMAAVINFVLQLIEHESFLYNYSVQGYSLASAGIVNHFFMGQLEIATVLMTAIPIFTYYLASASSMGMVMLAGTIDSSIKGGSMAAANSSMQGANMDNTSIGNTSMHNLSGYNDSTYSYAMGGVAMKVGQRSVDTRVTNSAGTFVSHGGDIAENFQDGTALVYNKNHQLVSASNPNVGGIVSAGVTSAFAKNDMESLGNSVNASNGVNTSDSGSLTTSYGDAKQKAWKSAIAQTHGLSAKVSSELTHYVEAGGKIGFENGALSFSAGAGMKAVRSLSKSEQLSLMQNYTKDLSNNINHSKQLSTSQASARLSSLNNSLNASRQAGENYQYSKTHSGTVTDNALRSYLNKMNEPLRKSGASIAELAKYDDNIIQGLERDPQPLENFINKNSNLAFNNKDVSRISAAGQKNEKTAAGAYHSLNQYSFSHASRLISEAAHKKYGYSENGHKEVAYADNIAEAKKLYAEGKMSKSLEEKYIKGQEADLAKAREVEHNIVGFNNKRQKAQDIVNVGPKTKNPITVNKLRAPQRIAMKSHMVIKNPKNINFK